MVKYRNSVLKDFKLHVVTDSNIRLLFFFFLSVLFSMKFKAGWVKKGI